MLHSEVTDNELSITQDNAPILTCRYGRLESHPYLHPLYVPNGQIVTDHTDSRTQYPPGICFTIGNVNGKKLDQQELTRERTLSLAENSEKFAISTTWNNQQPLLIVTLTTKVYPQQTEVQVLDIEATLHAPTTSLEFTRNTGLGARTIEMEYRKTFNADGRIGETEVNGHKSAWGALSGITATQQNAVGIALLPHPTNAETSFFADDTAYGFLFAEATPFTVDAKATHTLRYRLLAYIGDLFTFDVWKSHNDYTR